MKYLLIAFLALLSLLASIVNAEDNDSKQFFKKLTGSGWAIIMATFIVAIWTGWETFNEDKENDEKAKKVAYDLKKKNESDSVRFYQSYNKLVDAHSDILKNIEISIKNNEKQLIEIRKTNFQIPEEFEASFEAGIDIPKALVGKLDTIIRRIHNIEFANQEIMLSKVKLEQFRADSTEESREIKFLYEALGARPYIFIQFFDAKGKAIMTLYHRNAQSANTIGYDMIKKKFIFHSNKFQVNIARRYLANTLTDIHGKHLTVYLSLSANGEGVPINLEKTSIYTKDGLQISVEKFKKSTPYIFEKTLNKDEVWR